MANKIPKIPKILIDEKVRMYAKERGCTLEKAKEDWAAFEETVNKLIIHPIDAFDLGYLHFTRKLNTRINLVIHGVAAKSAKDPNKVRVRKYNLHLKVSQTHRHAIDDLIKKVKGDE